MFGEHPPTPGCIRDAFLEAVNRKQHEGVKPEMGERKQEKEVLQKLICYYIFKTPLLSPA